MILRHESYEFEMKFLENQINVLVIEKPQVMAKLVRDLYLQYNGKEGGFVLSDVGTIMPIEKSIEFILEPFSINCNNKKIVNKLYQELTALAKENLMRQSMELNFQVTAFLETLLQEVPYHLLYKDEHDVQEILKFADVRIDSEGETLLEQIVEYLRVMNQICGCNICVFLNLKSFLSREELKQLYDFVNYQKIYLVLLEACEGERIECEKTFIIDRDECIIEV